MLNFVPQRFRKIGTAIVIAAATVVATAIPASAYSITVGGDGWRLDPPVVTVVNTGSTGAWLNSSSGTNTCIGTYPLSTNPLSYGSISTIRPQIGRTAAYPYSVQKITFYAQVEGWTGTGWKALATSSLQYAYVSPGYVSPLFESRGWTVTPGYSYRVREVFDWYVNGVWVGEAQDLFDQAGYSASGGATYAASGYNASFCTIH